MSTVQQIGCTVSAWGVAYTVELRRGGSPVQGSEELLQRLPGVRRHSSLKWFIPLQASLGSCSTITIVQFQYNSTSTEQDSREG